MGSCGGHCILEMCNRVKGKSNSSPSPTQGLFSLGMRKSLPLGKVVIEEVPSPVDFHSIISLGNPTLLCSLYLFLSFFSPLSISSFPFAHSSFSVNISFLSRSFFWLWGFQWQDFSIMMITEMKFFSISLGIRKSRTEWAPICRPGWIAHEEL